MVFGADGSYALEIVGALQDRSRARERPLTPAQIEKLAEVVRRLNHLEKRLLLSVLCEAYDRDFLQTLGSYFRLPRQTEVSRLDLRDIDHDIAVIERIYSRKLSNNIVGYQALHYYENYLGHAI